MRFRQLSLTPEARHIVGDNIRLDGCKFSCMQNEMAHLTLGCSSDEVERPSCLLPEFGLGVRSMLKCNRRLCHDAFLVLAAYPLPVLSVMKRYTTRTQGIVYRFGGTRRMLSSFIEQESISVDGDICG